MHACLCVIHESLYDAESFIVCPDCVRANACFEIRIEQGKRERPRRKQKAGCRLKGRRHTDNAWLHLEHLMLPNCPAAYPAALPRVTRRQVQLYSRQHDLSPPTWANVSVRSNCCQLKREILTPRHTAGTTLLFRRGTADRSPTVL